jgi:hypothetical protein
VEFGFEVFGNGLDGFYVNNRSMAGTYSNNNGRWSYSVNNNDAPPPAPTAPAPAVTGNTLANTTWESYKDGRTATVSFGEASFIYTTYWGVKYAGSYTINRDFIALKSGRFEMEGSLIGNTLTISSNVLGIDGGDFRRVR